MSLLKQAAHPGGLFGLPNKRANSINCAFSDFFYFFIFCSEGKGYQICRNFTDKGCLIQKMVEEFWKPNTLKMKTLGKLRL